MSSRKPSTVHLTFSFRLALLYTVFLAVSSIVLFTTTYQLVSRLVLSRDRDVIRSQAEQFSALFAQGGVTAIANYFNQPITHAVPGFVRIVDQNNHVHFITTSHPLWHLLDQKMKKGSPLAPNGSRWDELAREESSGSWMVGTLPLGNGYFLQVGRSNTESQLVLSHFRRMGWRILLPSMLLSLLGGWLAAHSTLAPLRALVQTIHHILETGDQKRRVPVDVQRGELGMLTVQFNRVLDRNEMLVQGSRDTLDNVAHDLRTPMTHLRNSAEHALQMAKPDVHVQREALADCMEESDRILHMLNALMDLAEAQTGGMNLHPETISLHALADEVVELYSIVAEERGIALRNDVPTSLSIKADRMRLRQCIGNLVDNALKYSPAQREVTLLGSSDETTVTLVVRDHGCGIAKEDLPRIWDRLYRAERSRATPGLGLGLSMVRAIAEAHGGTMEVQSRPGEGSTFSIHLPWKEYETRPKN